MDDLPFVCLMPEDNSMVNSGLPQAPSLHSSRSGSPNRMDITYDSDDISNAEDLRLYATPSAEPNDEDEGSRTLDQMVAEALEYADNPTDNPGNQERTPTPVSLSMPFETDFWSNASVSVAPALPESCPKPALKKKRTSTEAFSNTADEPPPNKIVALTRDEPQSDQIIQSLKEQNSELTQRIDQLDEALTAERNCVQTQLATIDKMQTTLQEKESELQQHREQAIEMEASKVSLQSRHRDEIEKAKVAWRLEAEQKAQPLVQSLNEQESQILVLGQEKDQLQGQLAQAKEKCTTVQQQLTALKSQVSAVSFPPFVVRYTSFSSA
ncbi:hypothetical protein EDD18DRAFT_339386 [Armillaria luteobubalina]|uniref:Uncharacterized protein n=1 Tax=Armillaria luteobubalina TaxID=153913 RepID=A0AA39QM90_9AGAR|nr:hypothetical protein EDD18DRAFT_339386 [Armillaria luteobubalina]